MKSVPAEDILTNISQGNSVIYNNVTIIGDLALSKLNLIKDENEKYLIKSKISICGSNFSGKVLFGNAKFLNSIEFIDNNFNDDIEFNNCEFDGRVSFGCYTWGSIFNKQASFHNSIFNSDADFESAQFKDTDTSPKDLFLNTTFNDHANFDNASFCGNAYFTGATFFKDASFQYVRFHKEAVFGDFMGVPGFLRNPVFYEYLSTGQDPLDEIKLFGGANFYSAANFYRAEFNGNAYFKSTKFRGISSFKYATFRGDAIFGDRLLKEDNRISSLLRNNNFSLEESLADSIYGSESIDPNSADIVLLKRVESKQSKLDFERMQEETKKYGINSTFSRIAIRNETLENLFGATCFQENVNFIRANFEKNVYFINTTFRKDVDFFGTCFDGDIKFNNAKFYGFASFSDIRTKGDANFEYAEFYNDADFCSSEFSRNAYFDNAIFYGDFNLTNAKIEKIYLRWKSIKNHLRCNDALYLYLTNNFKNQGLFDDADDCWYDRMKIYQKDSELPWKIIYYLSWPICGYGVKPLYTIGWSILTILLFSLIFYRKNSLEITSLKDNHKEGKGIAKNETIKFYDAFRFSLIKFTSGGFALFWPKTEFRLNRNNSWASLEILLGWVFISIILYMIARIIIRI